MPAARNGFTVGNHESPFRAMRFTRGRAMRSSGRRRNLRDAVSARGSSDSRGGRSRTICRRRDQSQRSGADFRRQGLVAAKAQRREDHFHRRQGVAARGRESRCHRGDRSRASPHRWKGAFGEAARRFSTFGRSVGFAPRKIPRHRGGLRGAAKRVCVRVPGRAAESSRPSTRPARRSSARSRPKVSLPGSRPSASIMVRPTSIPFW